MLLEYLEQHGEVSGVEVAENVLGMTVNADTLKACQAAARTAKQELADKLARYYTTTGKNDAIVIGLAVGRFALTVQQAGDTRDHSNSIEYFDDDRAAFEYLINEYKSNSQLLALRDTHGRVDTHAPSYDYSELAGAFESFLQRGGKAKLVSGSVVDESYVKSMDSVALNERYKDQIQCFKLPFPVMSLLILDYTWGSKVIVGWGQRESDLRGKLCALHDTHLIQPFLHYFNALVKAVGDSALLDHFRKSFHHFHLTLNDHEQPEWIYKKLDFTQSPAGSRLITVASVLQSSDAKPERNRYRWEASISRPHLIIRANRINSESDIGIDIYPYVDHIDEVTFPESLYCLRLNRTWHDKTFASSIGILSTTCREGVEAEGPITDPSVTNALEAEWDRHAQLTGMRWIPKTTGRKSKDRWTEHGAVDRTSGNGVTNDSPLQITGHWKYSCHLDATTSWGGNVTIETKLHSFGVVVELVGERLWDHEGRFESGHPSQQHALPWYGIGAFVSDKRLFYLYNTRRAATKIEGNSEILSFQSPKTGGAIETMNGTFAQYAQELRTGTIEMHRIKDRTGYYGPKPTAGRKRRK